MYDIQIKISGPGGCIDDEASLIYHVLKANGYNVSISKPIDYTLIVTEERKELNGKWKINIKLDEQPWGS